jgi:HEAT repeat protein
MDSAEIDRLFGKAREEQERELREEIRNPSFEALIGDGSDEVFDKAAKLLTSADRHDRLLGVRILSEIGRPEMKFADKSVGLITNTIRSEQDSELLSWEVSALGKQHRAAALPTLLSLSNHLEPTVRDAVAGAISSAAQRSGIDADSIVALGELAQDPDDHVRFSAVFELASWWSHGENARDIANALDLATRDGDSGVARVARDALAKRPITGS